MVDKMDAPMVAMRVVLMVDDLVVTSDNGKVYLMDCK